MKEVYEKLQDFGSKVTWMSPFFSCVAKKICLKETWWCDFMDFFHFRPFLYMRMKKALVWGIWCFFGSFSNHLQEINVDGELFLKYETVLMDGMPFLQTNIAGWKVEAEWRCSSYWFTLDIPAIAMFVYWRVIDKMDGSGRGLDSDSKSSPKALSTWQRIRMVVRDSLPLGG